MPKQYFLIKKRPPTHTYKVMVTIYEDDELIAQHSDKVVGPKFSDVLTLLDVKFRDVWIQIKQMAHVADREQEKQNG